MILDAIELEKEVYTEEDYVEMLNSEGEISICGCKFYPADILMEMDPTAYRVGLSDMQEYKTVYICPICNEEYEDEDEAKFCCQSLFECPICGEEYEDEDEANNCCNEDEEIGEDE